MKDRSALVGALFAFLILLGSCTVQKRLYRPGLSIDWKGNILQAKASSTEESTPEADLKKAKHPSALVANENESNQALVSTLAPASEQILQQPKKQDSGIKSNPENAVTAEHTGNVRVQIANPRAVPFIAQAKTKQHYQRTAFQSNDALDTLTSILGIILLAGIVGLLVIGVLIGFVLLLRIFLFLLFLLLIGYLIYVFGLALM